jgi:hypothetical protein
VDWAKLITSAWSPKFMGLRRFLPPLIFSTICQVFAQIRHRRQVLCLAHKSTSDKESKGCANP